MIEKTLSGQKSEIFLDKFAGDGSVGGGRNYLSEGLPSYVSGGENAGDIRFCRLVGGSVAFIVKLDLVFEKGVVRYPAHGDKYTVGVKLDLFSGHTVCYFGSSYYVVVNELCYMAVPYKFNIFGLLKLFLIGG